MQNHKQYQMESMQIYNQSHTVIVWELFHNSPKKFNLKHKVSGYFHSETIWSNFRLIGSFRIVGKFILTMKILIHTHKTVILERQPSMSDFIFSWSLTQLGLIDVNIGAIVAFCHVIQ